MRATGPGSQHAEDGEWDREEGAEENNQPVFSYYLLNHEKVD